MSRLSRGRSDVQAGEQDKPRRHEFVTVVRRPVRGHLPCPRQSPGGSSPPPVGSRRSRPKGGVGAEYISGKSESVQTSAENGHGKPAVEGRSDRNGGLRLNFKRLQGELISLNLPPSYQAVHRRFVGFENIFPSAAAGDFERASKQPTRAVCPSSPPHALSNACSGAERQWVQ